MTSSYRNADTRLPIMSGSPPPPEWRVPFADWDRPPWNRWSFQNIRQILPTATVRRGSAPVWRLEHQPLDVGGVTFENTAGARMTVDAHLEDSFTDGFLVHMGGRVVHESYHNGMQPHTLHLAQSVSKSVTATVAGILIGRGMLDPAAPITDYLPELEATAWAGATLQQVMDMTSGVAYNEEYTDLTSDIAKTDVASGWKPIPETAPADAEWPKCLWDQILTLTARDAEHGARFNYRSIETDVMAHAMERVSGLRLADLVSQELWQKLGTEEDACYTVDSAGYALADGGFSATLRDFARFGLLHLSGGQRDGVQIIPDSFVQDVRGGDHGHFNDHGRGYFPNGRYRSQFWIEDEGRQTAVCLGVFGQMIYISPELDMVAVKLSSWPDFLDPDHANNSLRALRAIADAHGHL